MRNRTGKRGRNRKPYLKKGKWETGKGRKVENRTGKRKENRRPYWKSEGNTKRTGNERKKEPTLDKEVNRNRNGKGRKTGKRTGTWRKNA